jgi:tRNA threonylcarbamoyladenosine biosynthesis protein TsaB
MLLALDTALERCAVALFEGEECVAKESQDLARGHAEILMPMVARVCALPSQLTRIVVTVGPGSFTGLRVALSAAQAMGLALDIPVVGVNTLEALAFPFKGKVLAAIDARHGACFAALEGVYPAGFYKISELIVPEGCLFVGSGAVHFGQAQATQIEIESVAQLGLRSSLPATPLYYKAADVTPQTKHNLARSF